MASGSDKNMNGGEELDLEGLSDTETPSTTVNGAAALKNAVPRASVTNGTSRGEAKVLFSGDIIIKAQLDEDIRCTDYNNQELTFIDLLKLLERMFKEAIKATDDLVIKYKDSDGDYVTMEDDHDVGFAVRTCGGLNLKIFRTKKPDESKPLVSSDQVRAELIVIRDRVNDLLSQLDNGEDNSSRDGTIDSPPLTAVTGDQRSAPPPQQQQSGQQPSSSSGSTQSQGYLTFDNTDFDPLSGVSTGGSRRTDSASSGSLSSAPPPPQVTSTVPSVSSGPIKQVIDSFQPTHRDTTLTASSSGISSNPTIHRTDQPHDQQPSSQQQSQQHTSSLFDRCGAAAVKQAIPTTYQPGPVPASQYQPTPSTATQNITAQAPPVPASSAYNPTPGVSSQYATSTPYQPYPSQPSYQTQPSPYANPTSGSSAPTNNWQQQPDTSANYQARGYSQMSSPLPPVPGSAPMAGSSSPYGVTSPTSSTQMYGQLGSSQFQPSFGATGPPPTMAPSQPPPSMSSTQVPQQMGGAPQMPPPMAGVQGPPPPMGPQATFRPGGAGPPPSAGLPPGSNPYSRMGARLLNRRGWKRRWSPTL